MMSEEKHMVMINGIKVKVEEIEINHPGSDLTEENLKNMTSPSMTVSCKIVNSPVNKLRYYMWKVKNRIPDYKES